MKKYWDNYYKLSKSPIKPTKFSVFCRKYLKSFKGILYDVGCGNGRDTIYFNKLKIKSIGVDLSKSIIKKNKKKFKVIKDNFIMKDFSKLNFVNKKKDIAIYSRFSLHSIDYKKQKTFFYKIQKQKNVKILMIEVRTVYDELYGKGKKISKFEYFDTHYRRFLIPSDLKKTLSKIFKIKYYKVSRNFAIYKKENPKVLRLIALR